MIEEDESCFDGKHAMKMVLYEDFVVILNFTANQMHKGNAREIIIRRLDIYKILIDKDGITKQMLKPTYQISIIKTVRKSFNPINDSVIQHTKTCRDEILYEFMSETVIAQIFNSLIEWQLREHNWNITTNKYGRLFKSILTRKCG